MLWSLFTVGKKVDAVFFKCGAYHFDISLIAQDLVKWSGIEKGKVNNKQMKKSAKYFQAMLELNSQHPEFFMTNALCCGKDQAGNQ